LDLVFELIADTRCSIGESPVYDERADVLWFVDITGKKILRLDPATDELDTFAFDLEVASLGLAASGKLVVALRDRVVLFDPETARETPVAHLEAQKPETRLNDGKVGPDGAFWVGSMDDRPDKAPVGALYRVTAAGTVECKVEGLIVSNGLAWTADGEVMFHADSRGPWVDRWSFDKATGTISDRRRFAEPQEEGRPDGGACDVKGFYWSAGVSAGRLNRFGPDGKRVESHPLPIPGPTAPCFGGPDFRTIYLTSLREGRSQEALRKAPSSGSLYAAASEVAGFPAWRFMDI
jgi:sugar lactone lactonase YvrE